MYVLHVSWVSEPRKKGLIFWAEDNSNELLPSEDVQLEEKQVHPFTASSEAVLSLVKPLTQSPDFLFYELLSFDLLLPSYSSGPRSSPGCIHNGNKEGAHLEIRPWQIEGVRLTPEDTFDLLNQIRLEDSLSTGLRMGLSIKYWQHATTFLLKLLIEQKVLPTLKPNLKNGGFQSGWKLYLSGSRDRDTCNALGKSMPPCVAQLYGEKTRFGRPAKF